MQVIQFDEYGPPEVMHLAEVATPDAGPGQVQIRVRATGVNPADCKWRAGLLHEMAPLTFPHVVGYDVAGEVTAIGSDVSRFKVGDRVVATVAGGYAEVAIADEDGCALLPDGQGFDQAAALPCPALTGVQLIEDGNRPRSGETVLVIGATGGVGRFAMNAAIALGARVVAAVRPAYIAEARSLGADEVISLDDEVDENRSFDHVADTVGGDVAAKLCRFVSPNGTIMTVATLPIDPDGLPVAVEFFAYRSDGARLARIAQSVADGSIAMPVARCLRLSDAAEAHRLVEAGGTGGRIILQP